MPTQRLPVPRGRAARLAALALAATVGVFASGCKRPAGAENRIRISGASTIYPIVVMAGEALAASGSDLRIEAQAGGSSRGFEDTVAGRNDLGAMAREPSPEELQQVLRFPIAYDGVGVVVHASNPLTRITTAELRRIYRQEVDNWQALGGADEPIVAVTKAAGHATLETFLEHTGLDRSELRVDVVGGDNAQVIRVVANSPGAVGYVSLGEVAHSIEVGMPLRLLELDGVAPTLDNVAARSYPMFRVLYLVSKGEPRGASRAFLDFLGSAEGRQIIEQGKYVPLDA